MPHLETNAEKNSRRRILRDYSSSKYKGQLQQILDALPQPTALMSLNYQLLLVNKTMNGLLDHLDNKALFHKRIGDSFRCQYAHKSKNGCGSSVNCQFCGIIKALTISKNENAQHTEESYLSLVHPNGELKSFLNLRITTTPFYYRRKKYLFLTLSDISEELRRRMMERIFFHDILNKAGNILGIVDIFPSYQTNGEKSSSLMESLRITSADLIEEILYQRDFSAAEHNELRPRFERKNTLEIIKLTKAQIENSDVAFNKEILISDDSVNLDLITDGVLLRRVLLNMLKNALEATRQNGIINFGCKSLSDTHVRFWVQNNTVIPKEIQIQIFTKSFSTKESGLGLGTYSIRLLGEKYLKGKISFQSNAESGTVFMIDLPLAPAT